MQTAVVIAVVLAAGRVIVGTALMLVPAKAGGAWIGSVAGTGSVPVAIRALGVRDFALGGGLILAATMDDPVRIWLLAGAVSDFVDMVATHSARDRLDAGARRAVTAIAAFATVASVVLAFAVSA